LLPGPLSLCLFELALTHVPAGRSARYCERRSQRLAAGGLCSLRLASRSPAVRRSLPATANAPSLLAPLAWLLTGSFDSAAGR
jgi:hypothetical protein